jgi:hypothetical protein
MSHGFVFPLPQRPHSPSRGAEVLEWQAECSTRFCVMDMERLTHLVRGVSKSGIALSTMEDLQVLLIICEVLLKKSPKTPVGSAANNKTECLLMMNECGNLN